MTHSIILYLLLSIPSSWSVLAQPEDPQKPLLPPQRPPGLATLQLPRIGLGLWNSYDDNATNAVKYALKTGYHHLDDAAAYYNEQYVGAALNADDSPDRDSYWVTSKLWNDMHKPENVPKAFAQTLSDLNVTYLDLYLMHWPVAFLPNQDGRTILDEDTSIVDTWKAMEKLVATNKTHPEPGTTRYIGISNFSPRQVDEILDACTVRPYAHEFETHPYLQQQQFVNFHNAHGIKVIAYSPLANMNPTYDHNGRHDDLPKILTGDPFWKGVADAKNVTVAQAVLGWGVARNTIVIPKSTNPAHIRENSVAGMVEFSQEDLDLIAQHDKTARFNNPGNSWGVDLFEGLDDGFNPS